YSYSLSISVDGVPVANNSSFGSDWATLSVNLSKGIHTISIRASNNYPSQYSQPPSFSVDDVKFDSNPNKNDADLDGIGNEYDNCPSAANPTQADIDGDGAGDACDLSDNRPKDTDADGIVDYIDNCPTVKNPDQKNRDGDNFGDACDEDIDGDGISNAAEKAFTFMNELDPTDAAKDQDGDGVSNGFEIANSTNPAIADVFPTISLLDYYPLGEINSTYHFIHSDISLSVDADMKRLTTPNTYLVTIKFDNPVIGASESTHKIERRDSGIYLIEGNIGTEDQIEYDNYLILPASMKLGGSITNQSKITPVGNGSIIAQNTKVTFELIKTGKAEWKGISYPSITIRRTISTTFVGQSTPQEEHSDDITYLKGLGQAGGDGYVYDKIDIVSLDTVPQTPIETTPPQTPVETTPPQVPVETTPPQTPVETPPPQVPVETAPPQVPVETAPPQAPVETAPPQAPVETAPAKKKSGGGATDLWLLTGLILLLLANTRNRISVQQSRRYIS
ncbi:MAG TPA: thrombospondin type 3 repeat-containing protein, partial [Cellvibrio sp.]|nr:thrombospondin type 3 repeat-containing protein [Cellvibrio sp.]